MENDLNSIKGVTINFYISKDIIDKLTDEAEINSNSLNSLVNQILKGS
jgi:hypothetical protein